MYPVVSCDQQLSPNTLMTDEHACGDLVVWVGGRIGVSVCFSLRKISDVLPLGIDKIIKQTC